MTLAKLFNYLLKLSINTREFQEIQNEALSVLALKRGLKSNLAPLLLIGKVNKVNYYSPLTITQVFP